MIVYFLIFLVEVYPFHYICLIIGSVCVVVIGSMIILVRLLIFITRFMCRIGLLVFLGEGFFICGVLTFFWLVIMRYLAGIHEVQEASYIDIDVQYILKGTPRGGLLVKIKLTKILSRFIQNIVNKFLLSGRRSKTDVIFRVRVIIMISSKIKVIILFAI